jgi:hypothetical protein
MAPVASVAQIWLSTFPCTTCTSLSFYKRYRSMPPGTAHRVRSPVPLGHTAYHTVYSVVTTGLVLRVPGDRARGVALAAGAIRRFSPEALMTGVTTFALQSLCTIRVLRKVEKVGIDRL